METTAADAAATPSLTPTPPAADPTTHEDLHSVQKARSSIDSLSSLLPSHLPPSLSSSNNPAFTLLHDHHAASQISLMLRRSESGTGDDDLCRWLYDTFQSNDPNLQLVVLRYVPLITGLYLSRIARRKTLAGFEAVLLALYGSETASRAGQAVTVSIPDMSHSSIYHESKTSPQNNSTELNMAIISPSLEPHSTVRATRRAKIVGVALELYFSKISQMPVGSKLEFCEFCEAWAGQNGDMLKEGVEQAIAITGVPPEEPKHEATKQEPTQTKTLLGEGSKQELILTETPLREDSNQEPKQTETLSGEGSKQEPTQTGTLPGEGSKQEPTQTGTLPGEGSKKEPAQTETLPREDSKKEPAQTESLPREGSKQEPTQTVTLPREGRIPLPWELFQPALRILGHCLMGPNYKDSSLQEASCKACRGLYARAMHDVNPRAILAAESLLRLRKIAMAGNGDDYVDPTEPPKQTVITL